MSPGRRVRRRAPAALTCLKQKGMVRTLTPTMLFTTFMISPQLEAAAAVMARGLEPGGPGPGCEAPGRRRARGPEGVGGLPGGGGLAGRRRGLSTSGPRQTPRPPHGIVARSLSPAASASPRPDPEEPPAPTRHTSARHRCRPGAHTSACRGLPCPEVTAQGRALREGAGPSRPRLGGAWRETAGLCGRS